MDIPSCGYLLIDLVLHLQRHVCFPTFSLLLKVESDELGDCIDRQAPAGLSLASMGSLSLDTVNIQFDILSLPHVQLGQGICSLAEFDNMSFDVLTWRKFPVVFHQQMA